MSVEVGYIMKQTKDLLAFRPYNTATGEYWNWVKVPTETWTGYNSQVWEIERKDYTGGQNDAGVWSAPDGKFDINDAKFILAHQGTRVVNMNEFAGESVDRTYHGLQFVLNRRYANRWQGLFSVNWNKSDGIASRALDQNWYIDGPLVMDTPFGTTMNHFQNNTEGPLPMTPELMIKLSGSYTLPRIETDFGMRWRFDTGRPFVPVQGLNTAASWMSDLPPGVLIGGGWHEFMVADDPTEPDWTPNTSIIDLSVSKRFDVRGIGLALSLDVLNAFNESSPNRVGFHEYDYGRVYGLVQPRTMRLGAKLLF
jgi:hypothetical protein